MDTHPFSVGDKVMRTDLRKRFATRVGLVVQVEIVDNVQWYWVRWMPRDEPGPNEPESPPHRYRRQELMTAPINQWEDTWWAKRRGTA